MTGRLGESAGLSGNGHGSTRSGFVLLYSVVMRIAATFVAACFALAAPHAAGDSKLSCPRDKAWDLTVAAEQALQRAEWRDGARLYACAARAGTDAAVAERATRAAFENRQLDLAAEAARRWLELAPQNEVARRHLAISLLRNYEEDEAAKQFAELIRAGSDRSRGYVVLLDTLSQEENDTGAARIMEMLANDDRELPEAHYAASVLWQRAENGARALAAAERALALRPSWPQAELARVRALATAGRDAEARELSARVAAEGDPLARLNHAWLLLGQDRRDEAVALFEALSRSGGPASADAVSALAAIAIDERRLDDAAKMLETAARDPQQTDLFAWHLGRLAEERNDDANAARHYLAINAGPRAVTAQLRAYRLLRGLGSKELAEMLIDDFLDASPSATPDVVAGVAGTLVDEGRGDEAIALVDRAYEVAPDDSLLLARGFLFERLDRIPEAIEDLRKVADRRPNDPMAQNALGYTLVDRTRSIDEGRRLIDRALESKPDSYAIQDSKGWALVQDGELEEGKRWLETAWQRSEDPEVAAHLGETLWRMGREADARKLWDEALAANPDSPPLKRAIERRSSQ
jgi:tetratricopeptide (TPR) repeat protein